MIVLTKMYTFSKKRESVEYNAQEDLDKIYPRMPTPRIEIFRKDYVSKTSDANIIPMQEPIVIVTPAQKIDYAYETYTKSKVIVKPGPKKGKNYHAGRPKRILSPEALYQRRMVVKSFMDKGITNSVKVAEIMNEIRSNVWHDMLWLKKQPRSVKAQEKEREITVTLKKSK